MRPEMALWYWNRCVFQFTESLEDSQETAPGGIGFGTGGGIGSPSARSVGSIAAPGGIGFGTGGGIGSPSTRSVLSINVALPVKWLTE
jgi:hypothetical protein